MLPNSTRSKEKNCVALLKTIPADTAKRRDPMIPTATRQAQEVSDNHNVASQAVPAPRMLSVTARPSTLAPAIMMRADPVDGKFPGWTVEMVN